MTPPAAGVVRASSPLELTVRPPSPFRLPRYGGQDGTISIRGGVVRRFFEIEGAPVLVTAWQPGRDRVTFRAEALEPDFRAGAVPAVAARPADPEDLELAVDRLRFALGVDDDLTGFYARFKRDRLLGPLIHRRPWLRPLRQTVAWDALAWALVGQLIEARRAAAITRRFVRRWGRPGPASLRDTPPVAALAGCAPAEFEAEGLSGGRSIAMRRIAAEVASGRIDPADPSSTERLLAIPQIGPWTVQCLGLYGRGEEDTLPAGDLDYLKLVGVLAGLGRRAETEEVEDFFAPYAPYRGLAGVFLRLSARC